MNNYSVAACVTLYNPGEDVISNIESYIKVVDKLFIINNCNGESIVSQLSYKYPNIHVIEYGENMGISKPLNDVLALAIGKYDFLLTMDQDSSFTEKDISLLLNETKNFNWENTLGISPKLVGYEEHIKETNPDIVWKKELIVITSGNIINVRNALCIGGFNEKLFIDEVDNEFCLRGYKKGYFSYQCSHGIYLRHQIGTPTEVVILGNVFHPPSHNYIRTYYIFRNRIYTYINYWNIDFFFMLDSYIYKTFRMLISKLFFESDKKRKIKSILYAVCDFCTGKMGKKDFRY